MKKLMVLFLVLFLCTPAVAANWADSLEMGGDVRFRWYQMNNMWDFDDTNDYDNWETFRLRTRLFAKAKVSDDITGFVRLANQTYGNGVSDAGDNTSNKIFVDNAYITVKDFFGSNMTFQAGRMNLMYGSGFVLFDGNSQFASTSLYFDGAKLSIPLGENAVLDGFYVKDEENSRDNRTENDITLGGAYLTAHCPVMGGQQELYVLNRRDESITKDIWMTGIRLSDKFENGLDYSGEFAYQFGDFNENDNIDQEAYGYKLDAGFTLKDALMSPRLFCGYMFLQGDDPDTDEKERWDVFYGGWPQFGDLLAWKYVQIEKPLPDYNSINDYDPNWAEGSSTTGEAPYSNISMLSAGIGAQLTQSLSAKFTYGMLTVDEPIAGVDDDFGDYYQLQTKYGYSKNLSFSMYAAMITPGDAFINDDDAYEFFIETNLSF